MNDTIDTSTLDISAIPACWRDDVGRWRRMANDDLTREYLSMLRSCFGSNHFYHNAREALAYIVDELYKRNVREINNWPFGVIEVRKWSEW